MAIHDTESNTGAGAAQAGTAQPKAAQAKVTQAASGQSGSTHLNFGGVMSGRLINPNSLDGKTGELAKDIKAVFNNFGVEADVNHFANLVVVSVEKNGEVFFYTLVPSTHSTDLTVNQFIDTLMSNQKPLLAVDLVGPDMIEFIKNELARIYASKQVKTFVTLDGLVIPHDVDTKDERLVAALAGHAYNTIAIEMAMRFKEVKDVNIRESIQQTNGMSRLKMYSLTQESMDGFGRPVRTEFGVELTAPQTTGFLSALTNEEVIVSTKGYINVVPRNYVEQFPGQAPENKVGFLANIVINMMEQPVPTLGYAMIGIASTAVLAKDHNWVEPVMANAENIGYLNKFVNINNDKSPKAIDIPSLKIAPGDKAMLISKLINQGVVVSVDVPMYDDKITTLTPLAVAAAPDTPPNVRQAAEADIIETLNEVTDGAFGKYFNGGRIVDVGAILPNGEYAEKKGKVSIDHIDAPYVLKNFATGYQELIANLMYSELNFNVDSMSERVKFLNKIGVDAKLTGKKVRVTLTAEFINAMISAFAECGLRPKFDNTSVINTQTGLDFTSQYYQHAVLGQNLPNFVQAGQPMQQGFGYQGQIYSGYYRG